MSLSLIDLADLVLMDHKSADDEVLDALLRHERNSTGVDKRPMVESPRTDGEEE